MSLSVDLREIIKKKKKLQLCKFGRGKRKSLEESLHDCNKDVFFFFCTWLTYFSQSQKKQTNKNRVFSFTLVLFLNLGRTNQRLQRTTKFIV